MDSRVEHPIQPEQARLLVDLVLDLRAFGDLDHAAEVLLDVVSEFDVVPGIHFVSLKCRSFRFGGRASSRKRSSERPRHRRFLRSIAALILPCYLRPNNAGRNVDSAGHSVITARASSIASTNGHTAREISSKESRAI